MNTLAATAQSRSTTPQNWSIDQGELASPAIGAGLRRLQQWLLELYRRQLAYQDEDGVICITPEVADRFGLGIRSDFAFVALQPLEYLWAHVMDWSHAAMREGKTTLYLVAEPFEIDGIETPAFGISFVLNTVEQAVALQQHATLELRRLVRAADRWRVGSEIVDTMPLIVIGDDENVFETRSRVKPKSAHGRGR